MEGEERGKTFPNSQKACKKDESIGEVANQEYEGQVRESGNYSFLLEIFYVREILMLHSYSLLLPIRQAGSTPHS